MLHSDAHIVCALAVRIKRIAAGLAATELGKSRGAFPLDQRFEPFAEHCRTIEAPQSA
jgi:hypothetical protein